MRGGFALCSYGVWMEYQGTHFCENSSNMPEGTEGRKGDIWNDTHEVCKYDTIHSDTENYEIFIRCPVSIA